MSGLRESADSHEALLEQQRMDFGTFVRDRQDDLESQCSSINGWSQIMTSGLQQCNQDLEKFLDEDLWTDIPTGNTPVRREFSYPRVLAATSPHERILARFRELNSGMPHLHIPEVVRSSSGSSSASSEEGGSDMELLKDVPFRSASVTDIPSAADVVLDVSVHSEPDSRKESDNKENSKTVSLKKHYSDDLQFMKKRQPEDISVRRVLKSQN